MKILERDKKWGGERGEESVHEGGTVTLNLNIFVGKTVIWGGGRITELAEKSRDKKKKNENVLKFQFHDLISF